MKWPSSENNGSHPDINLVPSNYQVHILQFAGQLFLAFFIFFFSLVELAESVSAAPDPLYRWVLFTGTSVQAGDFKRDRPLCGWTGIVNIWGVGINNVAHRNSFLVGLGNALGR